MNNEIITKTDNQFGTVRCIEENGTVLFCASDVAKALGYVNANKAVGTHCLAITKRYSTISGRRKQEINFIPECDVYRLICHSKLPDAIRFEKWVFEDVVPNAVHGKQNSEPEQLTLETAEYHYYPKAWHGSPVITAADFAHFTGMSKEAIYPYFHKHPNFDIFHYRHLKNAELRDFKAENPSIPRCIADLYIITRKGCECMLRYFGLTADIPLLEKQEKEISPKLEKLNKGKTYNAAFIDELFRKEGVFMYGEEYIPLNTAVQYFCYASLFATPDAKATGQAHCVELRARDPKKPDTEYSFMGFNRAGIRHVVSLHNMMILGDKIHK